MTDLPGDLPPPLPSPDPRRSRPLRLDEESEDSPRPGPPPLGAQGASQFAGIMGERRNTHTLAAPRRDRGEVWSFHSDGAGGCSGMLLGTPIRWTHTVAVLALAALADICLYVQAGGTGSAALITAASFAFILASRRRGRLPAPGLGMLAGLAMLLGGLIWFDWWLVHFLAWAGLVALAIRVQRPDWRITELVWCVPWTVALAPFKLVGHIAKIYAWAAHSRVRRIRWLRHIPVRIILIPAGVTALFLVLFVAANPVVEHVATRISEQLWQWIKAFRDLFEFARVMWWLLWLVLFAGLMRPSVRSWVARQLRIPESLRRPEAELPEVGNYGAAVVTLICVNVLFLGFNALDAVYLYFHATLPEGITYAGYAYRGVAWLTLALTLSTAVLGMLFRRRMNFHERAPRLRLLAYVWVAQNGILAVGALKRLHMYVAYNGLTFWRLLGVYGILLVLAGLGITIWKVRRLRNFLWLLRRYLIALWVAAIVFACTPAEWLSWSYNVGRATDATGDDACRVLAGLAIDPRTGHRHQPLIPESLPPLIPLLDHEDPVIQEGIRSVLGREYGKLEARRHERANRAGVEKTYWAAWCASEAWALAELAAIEKRLRIPHETSRPDAHEQALLDRVRSFVHTPSLDSRFERYAPPIPDTPVPADARDAFRRGSGRTDVKTPPMPEGPGGEATGPYED
jgi:hypothetical protein